MVINQWKEEEKNRIGLDELVYRSNLLGSDRTIANWGGRNTSMKTIESDFISRDVEVMWVKGSGSDLATMKAGNFTGLRLHPGFGRTRKYDR
jgi:rhamnose utilization protein RhaD (predicted bifunctional aldolase and dehydrogenase)